MVKKSFSINGIPAVILGEESDGVYLFIHGQNGSKQEAERFAEIAVPKGWQVVGIDLPGHGERTDGSELLPWSTAEELRMIFRYLKKNRRRIAVRANSIGAWLSMLAFEGEKIEKCLYVSPVLDMKELIEGMMHGALVTRERLRIEKEIPTGFGQTLSWDYLMYAEQHPVKALCSATEILYAENDSITPRHTADRFIKENKCGLTVMEGGEHWFHTAEQIAFMESWEKANVQSCACV